MAWTDIASAAIAAGAPIKTGLLTDLRNNDIANAVKPVYVPIDVTVASAPTTYGASSATYYLRIPEDALYLRIRIAIWTASGTGTIKLRLQKLTGASGYSEAETGSTATAKGTVGGSADKTFTWTDVTNIAGDDLRGQECKIDVYVKHSAGSVQVDCESVNWIASYTSRA